MTIKTHKNPVARNHHFVPQFYLRGFTHTRNRQGKIFVVDAIAEKSFETVARNIAAEKDFNRLDIEGIEPDSLEKSLAGFEGLLAPALQRINASQSLDSEDDKIMLLNLIARLAISNPRWRSRINNVQEKSCKMVSEVFVSSEKMYESTIKNMKKNGYEPKNEVSYENLKKFVDDESYTIDIPRERTIRLELEVFEDILKCMAYRNWTVVPAAAGTGFITSDHPVCLLWSEPNEPAIHRHIGFGLRGTDVIFPVSNKLLVLGRFEDNLKKWKSDKIIHHTACFNSVIASCAERQIYSADENFLYLNTEGNLSKGSSIIDQPFLRRSKQSDD
jgi:hypothetical protein